MPDRLALVDYGAGNLRSVENALRAAGGIAVAVTADPDRIRTAERIVLPGVGSFGACMAGLVAIPGMIEALGEAVLTRGAPFLGICVGMQLMANAGEEFGERPGLGWIPGRVRAIAPSSARKVPHMGWNDVTPDRGHLLLADAGEAYFLHGYAFETADPAHRLAVTNHGGPLTAAVGRDTMVGVQFHPEKSQAYGLAFLSRFLGWQP